jgi:hypothetical protein
MKQCWTEQPEVRPTFDELFQQFKSLNGGKLVFDNFTSFKIFLNDF